MLEKLENETISGHFGFVFEENSDKETTFILSPFPKSSVFNTFPVHKKTKNVSIDSAWRAFS